MFFARLYIKIFTHNLNYLFSEYSKTKKHILRYFQLQNLKYTLSTFLIAKISIIQTILQQNLILSTISHAVFCRICLHFFYVKILIYTLIILPDFDKKINYLFKKFSIRKLKVCFISSLDS